MKASFNYTGRKKLKNEDFNVSLFESGNGASPEVEVSVHRSEHLGVSDSAVVWIEAYRGPRSMRFGLGRWGDIRGEYRFPLSDFGHAEPVLFRIKIVDADDKKHPIKAWRDRIRPVVYTSSKQKRRSVLPVFPCDLGHIAWIIDWEDPARPILKVNSRINDVRDVSSIVKNDPDFAILVFPEVIREVLTKLLLDQADDDDDADENEWLVFASNLAGVKFEGDESDPDENERLVNEWVHSVVQSFSRRAELLKRYSDYKSAI